MKKDDTLVEGQIDEDDDLLNISLDELNTDDMRETFDEEPDEDIIDLLDLLEKSDDEDLLGIDDDTDLLAGVATSTEELSPSDLDLDDLLLDSEKSNQPKSAMDDLDKLLGEESLEDLSLGPEGTGAADDILDNLLDETELEDLTADTGFKVDDAEESSLEIEDLLSEGDETEKAVLLDDEILEELAVEDVHDDLSADTGLDVITEENILGSDDEILDELDDVLEKSIVSSGDESSEESLWESDLLSETPATEEPVKTPDVRPDKADHIPMDAKSLEELLSESDLLEPIEGPADYEKTEDLTLEEDLTELQEEQPVEPSLEDLLEETDLKTETGAGELDYGTIQDLMADEGEVDIAAESPDSGIDDIFESLETEDSIITPESEEFVAVEETATSDFYQGDLTAEAGPDEEEIPFVSDDIPQEEAEIQVSDAPEAGESFHPDEYAAAEDIHSAISRAPFISEEKVEQIVREVVGEVVEKIAREVFAEVAEKVITEAIDSLKKSLVSDPE